MATEKGKQLGESQNQLTEFVCGKLLNALDSKDLIAEITTLEEYETVVKTLMDTVEIDSSLSRDEVIIRIYEKLLELNAKKELIPLILAIVDRSLESVDEIPQLKEVAECLLEDEKVDKDPTETNEIEQQLKIVKSGTLQQVADVIQNVGASDFIKRQITPFERAYIMEELRYIDVGDQEAWGEFIQRLIEMQGLKEEQILNEGAWYEAALRSLHVAGVPQLIADIKERTGRIKPMEKKKPKSIPAVFRRLSTPSSPPEPEVKELPPRPDEILDTVYSFWPEGSPHAEFLRSMEPEDYTLSTRSIPEPYKPWIYAAINIEPDEKRKKTLIGYLAKQVFKVSVGSIRKIEASNEEEIARFMEQNPTFEFPKPYVDESINDLIEDPEVFDRWKQKRFEYLDQNTEIKERAKMRVVCFPDSQCVNLKRYLDLGFDPENIIIICDPEKEEELQINANSIAREAGCFADFDIRSGDLEKLLLEMDKPLDVIDLDMFDAENLDLVKERMTKTLINTKAVIMLSIFLKDNDKDSKEEVEDLLKKFAEFKSRLSQFSVTRDSIVEEAQKTSERLFGTSIDRADLEKASAALLDIFNSPEITEAAESTIRGLNGKSSERKLLSTLVNRLGLDRSDFWRFSNILKKVFRSEDIEDNEDAIEAIYNAINEICTEIGVAMIYAGVPSASTKGFVEDLNFFLKIVLFKPPRTVDVKFANCQRKSESKPVFHSMFLQTDRLKPSLKKASSGFRFIAKVIVDHVLNSNGRAPKFQIGSSHGIKIVGKTPGILTTKHLVYEGYSGSNGNSLFLKFSLSKLLNQIATIANSYNEDDIVSVRGILPIEDIE